MLKNILLFVFVFAVSACGTGPRTAVDLAQFNGRKVEISLLEQDISVSQSSVTISFDGEVVHSSILQSWKAETKNPTRQLVSTQFGYKGNKITVKRKFDVGVTGALTTYLFYVDKKLFSTVGIVF